MNEETTKMDGAEQEGAPKKKAKKSHRKLWVALGVVAVIIAGAGIGYAVQHDNPAFCNAVCHSPMDFYVESYYEGDDLARVHNEANTTCLDCHEPDLGQQVAEGMKWITGDFNNQLDMLTDYDNDTCLKCHISEEVQAAKTDFLAINPHSDAHQVLKCTDCHKAHRDQVDYCSNCHDSKGHRMISWPLENHNLVEEQEE